METRESTILLAVTASVTIRPGLAVNYGEVDVLLGRRNASGKDAPCAYCGPQTRVLRQITVRSAPKLYGNYIFANVFLCSRFAT